MLCTFGTAVGHRQTVDSLREVKTVYVDSFGGKLGAAELRQQIIERLTKSKSVKVVDDEAQADGVLKGNGDMWTRGRISVSPRASVSNESPVYGGFLSAQLVGKDQQMLWSYLVTPSRYAMSGIRQDLADQLVKRMLAALHEDTSGGGPNQPTQMAPHTLSAAGATFPAPLYQSWFYSCGRLHPGIVVRYDSVGSEAGVRLLSEKKIAFAASDVPLSAAGMP